MKRNLTSKLTNLVVMLILSACVSLSAQDEIGVSRKSLAFLASFDSSLNGDVGKGDLTARFAEDVSRKKFLDVSKLDGVAIDSRGKFGSSVYFSKKTKSILCFQAKDNFPYSATSFDATVSFWMLCDPAKLPAGYIDPLQITDKTWNDASIFVDFNDKRPADFRLGVFSNIDFWNPDKRKFDTLKAEERPMVDAGKGKFSADHWVHVGLVFKGINSDKNAQAQLYINGKSMGILDRKQKFTWDLEKTYMMLGIYYVGRIDDFAVFNQALSDAQIQGIATSQRSISKSLSK